MIASRASVRAGPRLRHRATAALVLVVLIAGFLFWLGGLPVLILWALTKAIESSAQHFVLGLIAVPTAMAWFGLVLIWLNGVYLRLTGAGPVANRDGLRRPVGGPLEFLLVSSLLVAIVALLIWFFFFAQNPPRQFI